MGNSGGERMRDWKKQEDKASYRNKGGVVQKIRNLYYQLRYCNYAGGYFRKEACGICTDRQCICSNRRELRDSGICLFSINETGT